MRYKKFHFLLTQNVTSTLLSQFWLCGNKLVSDGQLSYTGCDNYKTCPIKSARPANEHFEK